MSCHVMRCGIMSGDVTTSCCCHEKCITNSAPATKSDTPTSPNSTPATKSDTPTSANLAPATKSDAPTSNSAHARTSHTPTSPNSALATKSRTPTSPNAAPATKSHITLCDAYHMRRHLQWRTSRPWAEHDPNMIRPWGCNWPRLFAELNLHPFCMEEYNVLHSGYLPITKCCPGYEKVTLQHHEIVRVPSKVRLQHHQMLKMRHCNVTKCCACHETWHCNITKCCVCHEKWQSSITQNSGWHETWLSWLIFVTHGASSATSPNFAPGTKHVIPKYRENYSCGLEDRILVKKNGLAPRFPTHR